MGLLVLKTREREGERERERERVRERERASASVRSYRYGDLCRCGPRPVSPKGMLLLGIRV